MTNRTAPDKQPSAQRVTRRSHLHFLFAATTVAAGGLLASACRPTAASGGQPPEPKTAEPAQATAQLSGLEVVHMGSRRTVGDAGWIIATQRGYFRELGIDPQVDELAATDLNAALATGRVDAGTIAVSAGLFNAVGRGVPIKIVGPQARMDPGASSQYFVVRKDLIDSNQFVDYPMLRGKKVAVAGRGATPDYVYARAMSRGGLQPREGETVTLDFPEMTTALEKRAVDVVLQVEPTATLSVTRGVGVKWREVSDVTPGLQNTVVLFGPSLASTRPDLARRWMMGYLRGVRDYHAAFMKNGAGRSAVVQILTQWTPVTDATLYDQMGFPYIDPNGAVNASSLRDLLDFFSAEGTVTSPVNLDQVLDSQFVDAAVKELGVYSA